MKTVTLCLLSILVLAACLSKGAPQPTAAPPPDATPLFPMLVDPEVTDHCAPPPARRIQLPVSACGGFTGFLWNGKACEPIFCQCTRVVCRTFETLEACEVAHADCR